MQTTTIDSNAAIADTVRQLGGMYAKDLDAITQEQYTGCIGGKCRSAHDFTAETAGFNSYVAAALAGVTMEATEEVRAEKKAALADKEAGKAAIVASASELADAITANADRLSEEVMAPWGQPMPAIKLVLTALWHIGYHDAQINYIQSHGGDDQVHWM